MCMYLNDIENVVNEFVAAEKMFTAWDVTMEVRKRSKQRVQHFEVKKEVHKIFDQGNMSDYNRTLANLQNINPQPWVYHLPESDPSLYDGKPTANVVPTPIVSNISVAPAIATISNVDDGVDIAADGSTVYKFDTTDRLCIPNKLVREIGLKAGDEVEITQAVDGLFVQPTNGAATAATIASYVVDRYDNVRISRAVLNKIGVSGVAFEIFREGATNSIKVKKYA